MKSRCLNPNYHSFHRYGGRGIGFCKRWRKFENFLKDMGSPPVGFSLDRINSDKNYSPKNCRWISKSENSKNRKLVNLLMPEKVTVIEKISGLKSKVNPETGEAFTYREIGILLGITGQGVHHHVKNITGVCRECLRKLET